MSEEHTDVVEIDAIAVEEWDRDQHTPVQVESNRAELVKKSGLDESWEPGTPVLISDRITYGPDGTALVADRATILGSMMQITAERAATGLSLHWGATPPP